MLLLRYPRLKWDLLEWPPGEALEQARNAQTAFDATTAARIGFYNEGFMGNEDHYAMFQLPGEDEFMARDSGYVVHEGEVSNASAYKLVKGRVVRDMTRFHQTALNFGGDGWEKVQQAWKQNGDYQEVTRRMGYRYRLVRASLPHTIQRESELTLRIELTNDGFARLMNPRPIELVLRSDDGVEWVLPVTEDARRVLPGPGETATWKVRGGVPAEMAAGGYQMFLALPDAAKAIARRVEYSIRLANDATWDQSSGYNRLKHRLQITADAPQARHSGDRWLKRRVR
jgi:hypothetical protein